MTIQTSLRRALDLDDEVGRVGRAGCSVLAVLLALVVLPLTPLYPEPLWGRVLVSTAVAVLAYPLGLAVIRAVRGGRRRT